MTTRSALAVTTALAAAVMGLAPTTAAAGTPATRPSSIGVAPAVLAPGQPLTVNIYCVGRDKPWNPQANSPGFDRPVDLVYQGTGGTGIGTELSGTGRATWTPGRYVARYDCFGWTVSADFEIRAPGRA